MSAASMGVRDECLTCGVDLTDADTMGSAPHGWTEVEWDRARVAAYDAGDCPACDHDDIRATGTRRELVGDD